MQIAVGVTFQVNSYCCLSLDKCAGEDLAMTSLFTTEKKNHPIDQVFWRFIPSMQRVKGESLRHVHIIPLAKI